MNDTINPARGGLMAAITCALIALLFCAFTFHTTAAADDDPSAPIRAIYMQAAAGNGDVGGNFVYDEPKDRRQYLSKSLIALWADADAKTKHGDAGPIDFDPISNSQDPQVYDFEVKVEKQDARRAIVAATFVFTKPPQERQTTTVTYELVRESDAWKIDDIRGRAIGNGRQWSVRHHLANFKG